MWTYHPDVAQWLWSLAFRVEIQGWQTLVFEMGIDEPSEDIMNDALIEAGLYLPWVPPEDYPYGYPGSATYVGR